jgi:hypothetical protein
MAQITVTWTASADTAHTGYYVWWDTSSHAGATGPTGVYAYAYDYASVGDVPPTQLSHAITGLISGQTYFANVTTHGGGGHDAYESELGAEVSAVARLPAPANFRVI